MPGITQPRTRSALTGSQAGRALQRSIGDEIHRFRVDAGLSARAVARAAGISHSTLLALELGTHDPTVQVIARVGAVLGCRLGLKLLPGAGPAIRDHVQTLMTGGMLTELDAAWRRSVEVPVFRPIRGFIDLAIERDLLPIAVAIEAHSQAERIEQMVRWSMAKSDALSTRLEELGRPRPVSRVLLLRSTSANRAAVALARGILAEAFPARTRDAVDALRDASRPWPGAAIVWMTVEHGSAKLLDQPPRGIVVGR
jgi:transcriptional regulator with XRE-family HTH domain